MPTTCTQCSSAFEITAEDLAFYDKVSPVFAGKKELIPPPTLCPDCRKQQRFSFRNEWNFYHRKCDLSGQQIISLYHLASPYKVYDQKVWWSDQFDPLAYGRDFHAEKSFFAQVHELNLAVPKVSIQNAKSENCAYTNYSAENRNCYLVVGGLGCEDNYFSYRPSYCKDICDCYDTFECELCYEVSESSKLYNCQFSRHCHNATNLTLCSFCTGCSDCFGCMNIRQKQYCIFNRQYDKETYVREVAALSVSMDKAHRKYETFRLTQPHRARNVLKCEECSGDNIWSCKNCANVFTLKESEHCSFMSFGENNKTCMDANFCDNCELQYLSSNLEKNYSVVGANLAWYVQDSAYVTSCFNSHHLFGCIGMKKHSYCILNKQYTKEEYEKLVPLIIEHMRRTGEWGSYFPSSMSPFGYNETIASEYYPLTQGDAGAKGWQWYEEPAPKDQYLGPKDDVPRDIQSIDDDICKKILLCEVTGKPYKIIPQELAFYRKMQIGIPKKCPTQRHKERMALRNPDHLWMRECARCKRKIESSYAPQRPEIVWCEECYLASVY